MCPCADNVWGLKSAAEAKALELTFSQPALWGVGCRKARPKGGGAFCKEGFDIVASGRTYSLPPMLRETGGSETDG